MNQTNDTRNQKKKRQTKQQKLQKIFINSLFLANQALCVYLITPTQSTYIKFCLQVFCSSYQLTSLQVFLSRWATITWRVFFLVIDIKSAVKCLIFRQRPPFVSSAGTLLVLDVAQGTKSLPTPSVDRLDPIANKLCLCREHNDVWLVGSNENKDVEVSGSTRSKQQ